MIFLVWMHVIHSYCANWQQSPLALLYDPYKEPVRQPSGKEHKLLFCFGSLFLPKDVWEKDIHNIISLYMLLIIAYSLYYSNPKKKKNKQKKEI